ncbi:BPSS1780 family membrane protein [Roseateles sp. NT4]|uniref:BPSS1780 family membrane protein n=1 Tax=Roseateles sp. NT4 TaxID=3453715 RepID=UPI003EED5244
MTMQLHLQQVPAGNGRLWIRHGFKVFRRAPLALACLFGLFMFVACAVLLVPGVGVMLFLASLPLLSLGFMLATHLVLQKKTPTVSVFIAPLKLTAERRRSQLLLCGGYATAVLLIGLLAEWVDGGAGREFMTRWMAGDANGMADSFADPHLAWGMSLRFGLAMLLTVPYWHAPALVHWGGQGAAQALFSSALALWRNRAAFVLNGLLWGLIMLAAGILPALLLGALGLTLLIPVVGMLASIVASTVFYASLYFTFVDCFMFGAPQNLLDDQQA